MRVFGPSLARLPMIWPPAPVWSVSSNDTLAFGQLAAAAVNSASPRARFALSSNRLSRPPVARPDDRDRHDIGMRRTWRARARRQVELARVRDGCKYVGKVLGRNRDTSVGSPAGCLCWIEMSLDTSAGGHIACGRSVRFGRSSRWLRTCTYEDHDTQHSAKRLAHRHTQW